MCFWYQKPANFTPKNGAKYGSLALSSGQGSTVSSNLWEHSQTMPTLRGLDARQRIPLNGTNPPDWMRPRNFPWMKSTLRGLNARQHFGVA